MASSWEGDSGEDSEPYPQCGSLRLGHFRPTPEAVLTVVDKYSGQLPDAAVACFMKFDEAGLKEFFEEVFAALRKPVDYTADKDITYTVGKDAKATGEIDTDVPATPKKGRTEVLCKAGDIPLGWHLPAGKTTDALWAKAKANFMLEHKQLFSVPDTKQKIDDEWKTDEHGRWDIAPFHFRLIILDGLFKSCAAKMRKYSKLREADTEIEHDYNWGKGPKGKEVKKLEPSPRKNLKRKINSKFLKLKTRRFEIKDGTSGQPDKVAQRIMMEKVCSGDLSTLHIAKNDINVGNLSLDMLWTALEEKQMSRTGRYLQWDYNDCNLYVTTDARLQKMVRELWKSSGEAEDPLTVKFELRYKSGPYEDKPDDWLSI